MFWLGSLRVRLYPCQRISQVGRVDSWPHRQTGSEWWQIQTVVWGISSDFGGCRRAGSPRPGPWSRGTPFENVGRVDRRLSRWWPSQQSLECSYNGCGPGGSVSETGQKKSQRPKWMNSPSPSLLQWKLPTRESCTLPDWHLSLKILIPLWYWIVLLIWSFLRALAQLPDVELLLMYHQRRTKNILPMALAAVWLWSSGYHAFRGSKATTTNAAKIYSLINKNNTAILIPLGFHQLVAELLRIVSIMKPAPVNFQMLAHQGPSCSVSTYWFLGDNVA